MHTYQKKNKENRIKMKEKVFSLVNRKKKEISCIF